MPRLTLPNKAFKPQSSEEHVQSTCEPTCGLLALPWDVRRLIFENVPTSIWRSIPVGYGGFYYVTKSPEVNLLQVSGQVNAEASYAMQNSQADQPCVLAFHPFDHPGITKAIMQTVSLAHNYDEIYTQRVPSDQKPALAISPMAAALNFQTHDESIRKAFPYQPEEVMPDLSEDELNTFITQVLLQLRRKPKIELHLHLTKRSSFPLIEEDFAWALHIIGYFGSVIQENREKTMGKLRYHLTVFSEDKEMQRQLQARWLGPEIDGMTWEVVREQDQEAWRELDKSFKSKK